MSAPNSGRIRAISEHIHSLGCYTQALELDRAADLQDELIVAVEQLLLASKGKSANAFTAIDNAYDVLKLARS